MKRQENRNIFKSNEKNWFVNSHWFYCKFGFEGKKAQEVLATQQFVPSFTLGGTGGGVVNNEKEFISILKKVIKFSNQ